jgi:hypothetical protein
MSLDLIVLFNFYMHREKNIHNLRIIAKKAEANLHGKRTSRTETVSYFGPLFINSHISDGTRGGGGIRNLQAVSKLSRLLCLSFVRGRICFVCFWVFFYKMQY